MSDPLNVIGVVLSEKFRVERLLGEGGFGVVYAGTHLLLRQPVAIKFMKVDSSDADRANAEFQREARILFSLSHPAIVRMYDVGSLARGIAAIPWVVLELLEGPTLDREISTQRHLQRRPSIDELRRLFDPLVDALAFAHARDIIHRDIKPANILLSRPRPDAFEPKLLDFGTARSQASSFQTSAGRTGFTPLYAAPEQWDPSIGKPTPATDVYSMGLTILEAATLHKAFGEVDNIAVLMQSVATGIGRPRLLSLRPDLPNALQSVLERATAPNPLSRYRNGGELQAALKQAFSGQIVNHPRFEIPSFASTPPLSPHAMTASPPVSPSPLQGRTNPSPTTSPFVGSQKPVAPSSSTITVVAVAFAVLMLVVGGTVGAVAWLNTHADREAGTLHGANARTATGASGPISAPLVSPNEDFDIGAATKVVQSHQSEIEDCARSSAKWTGELGIAIEVSATDGHVIGATCHTNWPHHDSKNPTVDPNAIAFCSCAQAAIPAWKFKAPKADVVFPGVEDTQTLQVKYIVSAP